MCPYQLRIGNLTIDPACIEYVVISSTGPVNFGLLALEEEGRRLEGALRSLEKEPGMKFFAQDDMQSTTGHCNVKVKNVEKDETKAPVRYRIHASLERLR